MNYFKLPGHFVLTQDDLQKLKGGFQQEEGQPIGETKGDPPPLVS